MKFSKAMYKVLHMCQGNPKHKYRLCGEWIESRPEEKELGVLADEKLNMTWQCVLTTQKANRILSCIKISIPNRLREEIFHLCSALVQCRVLCPAQEPSMQERHGPVGAGPEKATEMV